MPGTGAANAASLRRLAGTLRQLRGTRPQAEVAEALGWSTPALGRLERGQETKPQHRKVQQLLDHYGVTGEQRELILALVDQVRYRGWWWQYRHVLADPYMTLIGLEDAATHLRSYQPNLIPGLLQTEEYARAVHVARTPELPQEQIDALVSVRMRRQQRLHGDDPIMAETVLGETALRTRYGNGQVMADQLTHLIKMAQLPNVRLKVLPHSVAPPASGPFVLVTFPETIYVETVYIETPVDDMWIDDEPTVRKIKVGWEGVRKVSLNRTDSLALITAAADDHRRG